MNVTPKILYDEILWQKLKVQSSVLSAKYFDKWLLLHYSPRKTTHKNDNIFTTKKMTYVTKKNVIKKHMVDWRKLMSQHKIFKYKISHLHLHHQQPPTKKFYDQENLLLLWIELYNKPFRAESYLSQDVVCTKRADGIMLRVCTGGMKMQKKKKHQIIIYRCHVYEMLNNLKHSLVVVPYITYTNKNDVFLIDSC